MNLVNGFPVGSMGWLMHGFAIGTVKFLEEPEPDGERKKVLWLEITWREDSHCSQLAAYFDDCQEFLPCDEKDIWKDFKFGLDLVLSWEAAGAICSAAQGWVALANTQLSLEIGAQDGTKSEQN